MTLLDQVQARADPGRAADMAAYHKADRPYLGVGNPEINALAAMARKSLSQNARLAEAGTLWSTNIHEARILAAKLFDQRSIRDDASVWALICRWVPDFDGWAIADHVSKSGAFRLLAEPARLDQVEAWTGDPSFWVRRTALIMTLPWARLKAPGQADLARRERILSWASGYADDPEWFIQKAIGWWLRELSARDPARVLAFIAEYGPKMKPFAVREAVRNMGNTATQSQAIT